MTNTTHSCAACGATFEVEGGWNNYGKTLHCTPCAEKRQFLIADIMQAQNLRPNATLYVKRSLYRLLRTSDFAIEISPRADERMGDNQFQVEEEM